MKLFLRARRIKKSGRFVQWRENTFITRIDDVKRHKKEKKKNLYIWSVEWMKWEKRLLQSAWRYKSPHNISYLSIQWHHSFTIFFLLSKLSNCKFETRSINRHILWQCANKSSIKQAKAAWCDDHKKRAELTQWFVGVRITALNTRNLYWQCEKDGTRTRLHEPEHLTKNQLKQQKKKHIEELSDGWDLRTNNIHWKRLTPLGDDRRESAAGLILWY